MIFTGERFISNDIKSRRLAQEHWHRYLWATNFAKNATVLDIACGEGYGANYLAKYAKNVIGADISEETIQYAAQHYKKNNLQYQVMNSNNINIDNNTIDLIVSFETIEHMNANNQIKTLSEYSRVLKSDGILLITTPGTESPRHCKNNKFHLKECSLEEFKLLLQKHFKNVKIVGQSIYECSIIGDCLEDTKTINTEFPNYDKIKNYNLKEDKYLVAVCSNKDIAEKISSIMIDRKYDDTAIHQKLNLCPIHNLILYQIKICLYAICFKISKKDKYFNRIRKCFEKILK